MVSNYINYCVTCFGGESNMTYITVKQLMKELQAIPEELHNEEVRIMIDPEEPDSMLKAIEVRHKGQSGYEYHGEVLLVGEQQ